MLSQHVFISYARADGKEFAARLHADLGAHEIDTWLDVADIPAGAAFDGAIDNGLEEAKAVLVLLTPGSVLSLQVQSEWNEALNRLTPILPLLVRQCNIPRVLKVFEYVDFTQAYKQPLKKLLNSVKMLETDHLRHLRKTLSAFNEAKKGAPHPRRFQPKIQALRRKVAEFEQRNELQRERIARRE